MFGFARDLYDAAIPPHLRTCHFTMRIEENAGTRYGAGLVDRRGMDLRHHAGRVEKANFVRHAKEMEPAD